MLSTKNDDFKFLKNSEKHKKHVHHVHHSSRARETVYLPNETRNMNVKVAVVFGKISKFKYW